MRGPCVEGFRQDHLTGVGIDRDNPSALRLGPRSQTSESAGRTSGQPPKLTPTLRIERTRYAGGIAGLLL